MARPEIDKLKQEITEGLQQLAPRIEGLMDFGRLNLIDKARNKIVETFNERSRRKGILDIAMAKLIEAEKALEDLDNDGHPILPKKEVETEVLQDLLAQKSTIEAALADFFSLPEAVSGEIKLSPTDLN